jgi:hypothetical protein
MKKGRAFVQTVTVTCPYCGGPVSDRRVGSLMIEWDNHGPLICLDCDRECAMPQTVDTGSGSKSRRP